MTIRPRSAVRPRIPRDTWCPSSPNLDSPVQNELLIVSPYFVPGDTGVAWLGGLVKRGVRVTVLTNSLAATDVGAVHAGYQRYRKALLEAGVRLYELKPEAIEHERAKRGGGISGSRASLHAKTFVFDRRAVFIGSLNLDPRSIQLNTEIGLVCESAPLAEDLAGTIEQNLDKIAWRLELIRRCLRQQAHCLGGDRRRGRPAAHGRTRGEHLAQVLGVVPRAAADRVPALIPDPYQTTMARQ